MFKKIINYLTVNPKKLFLIDFLGAILTVFLLNVLIRNFNEYFGMPKEALDFLSIYAMCLFLYSLLCFLFLKKTWTVFIRGISLANLIYCFLTVGLLIVYDSQIKILGMIYFLTEIFIICGLVCIEFKVEMAISREIKP